jgi:Hg(II)-responsive transcriptional regulator
MASYKISQIANEAGVNVETLRYYERIKIMPPPERKKSGYRVYSKQDLKRLFFIKRTKELGFTLNEIKELLELRINPESTCGDVLAKATEKMVAIDQKIRELKQIKQALSVLAASCSGKGPSGECPILDALEQENQKK